MSGKPWKDLLSGVKALLEGRLARNSNDRISIIVFSSDTRLAYLDETITNIDLSSVYFPCKTTNFIRAFSIVHEVIQQTEEKTLKKRLTKAIYPTTSFS
jgi:hypothetical protein